MIYETAVPELFQRFPRLEETWKIRFAYMGAEKNIQYLVFGSVLIPALEDALSVGDLGVILPVCAFLEDVAVAAKNDAHLESLLRVEVGEWLACAANESLFAPWLGTETRRICRYVPGLATQRIALRQEKGKRSLCNRLSSSLKRLRKK